MAALVKRLQMKRRTLNKNHFEALITAIIFQQISGSAGASILKKFKALYGGKVPTPKIFLLTKEKLVRGAGISPQKYSYLTDLSERIEDGRLELTKFYKMDDAKVVEELDEVRGIGRWTAEMFLMFTLGRTDVLPVDDLGLKKGLMKAYKLKKVPNEATFRKLAKKWHPYCTLASLYLWRILDDEDTEGNW
jgi:DNA-3-methyladenine glycosylase II